MRTKQGAQAYDHSMNHHLEFFSKAGSLYVNRGSYYGGESTALELFKNAYIAEKELAMKLLFWLRDCRGGAGNRSGARECFKWVANNDPIWIAENMHLIPFHGRWDDVRSLFNTPLEDDAAKFWGDAISEHRYVLAAKWAKLDKRDAVIRNYLGLTKKQFRKLLAGIRKDHIVEHKMCQKVWENIDYSTVPSVAMARYARCFAKNDETRFTAYKESLKRGEATVHADALFPHDCVRTCLGGDAELAEQQFNALPNFLNVDDMDERIMTICDSSGSMSQMIGRSINVLHVAMGITLYCSSRMPENSPFYKRFIAFCDEGKFKDWRDMSFKEAVGSRERYGRISHKKKLFDGAVGSTRIDKALNLILDIAKERNIQQKYMPTTLMIVSDMQFDEGVGYEEEKQLTQIERCMLKFDREGYKRPKVLYWNLAGYEGQQATVNQANTGLVSGFSPSILKAVFGGQDFSPYAIMMKAIEKYEVIIPE